MQSKIEEKKNIGVGAAIAALAMTLDQHFPGFLKDFEQNAARTFDLVTEYWDAEELSDAGYAARAVEEDDLLNGHRRGER